MTLQQVQATLEETLGDALMEPSVRSRTVGVTRPLEIQELWARVPREALLEAVRCLMELAPSHLSVISGRDAGDEIELLYHLAAGYGTEGGEILVTLRVFLDKTDLRAPSLCGLIPGAETTEREKREFLGVEFDGLPDTRNLFLPDDMTAHPWRTDDAETAGLVRRTVKWEERDGGD